MTGSSDRRPSHAQPSTAVGLARIPLQGDRLIACRRCGTATTTASARVTGAWSVVEDRPVWDCDACTRALLIEFETYSR